MCIHTYIFQVYTLKRPRSHDITTAMSTLSNQILVSNMIHQKIEPGILGKMADSRAGAGYGQDKPGEYCSASKEVLTHTHNDGAMPKRQEPTEKASSGYC